MSKTQKITQLEDHTYKVLVTTSLEIGPETWPQQLGDVDPLQVKEIEVNEVNEVKKRAFSAFPNLETLIFKTSPRVIHPETVEGCYRIRKIHLPIPDDPKNMKVFPGSFYGFNTFMSPRQFMSKMIFRWEDIKLWIDAPIDPEDTEKNTARNRFVIDHGIVTNFEQVCSYWMDNESGNYKEIDAYTRMFSMYVPGFSKEDGVMANIMKRPAGATIKVDDPEHWMQCGEIRNFFSFPVAISIPKAKNVGEGISLTVLYDDREYSITGWGRSSKKTLKDFLLPQLSSPWHHKNPEITKIEVLMFEYDWSGDTKTQDFSERPAEWEDMQDVTMQRFLCYVMSGEVDPKGQIKVY